MIGRVLGFHVDPDGTALLARLALYEIDDLDQREDGSRVLGPARQTRQDQSYFAIDGELQRQAASPPASPRADARQTFTAVRAEFVHQVLGAIQLEAGRTKRHEDASARQGAVGARSASGRRVSRGRDHRLTRGRPCGVQPPERERLLALDRGPGVPREPVAHHTKSAWRGGRAR